MDELVTPLLAILDSAEKLTLLSDVRCVSFLFSAFTQCPVDTTVYSPAKSNVETEVCLAMQIAVFGSPRARGFT